MSERLVDENLICMLIRQQRVLAVFQIIIFFLKAVFKAEYQNAKMTKLCNKS